jgi:hypothetical protein
MSPSWRRHIVEQQLVELLIARLSQFSKAGIRSSPQHVTGVLDEAFAALQHGDDDAAEQHCRDAERAILADGAVLRTDPAAWLWRIEGAP